MRTNDALRVCPRCVEIAREPFALKVLDPHAFGALVLEHAGVGRGGPVILLHGYGLHVHHRIYDRHLVQQRSTVIDRADALDDMHLSAVRHCAERDGLDGDRVDDQRVAFPTPDRMAVALRKRTLGMRVHVEENAPHLLVQLHRNRDLIFGDDDLDRIVSAAER